MTTLWTVLSQYYAKIDTNQHQVHINNTSNNYWIEKQGWSEVKLTTRKSWRWYWWWFWLYWRWEMHRDRRYWLWFRQGFQVGVGLCLVRSCVYISTCRPVVFCTVDLRRNKEREERHETCLWLKFSINCARDILMLRFSFSFSFLAMCILVVQRPDVYSLCFVSAWCDIMSQ